MEYRKFFFVLIFLLGIFVRIIGIDWGISKGLTTGDPPFHPDEIHIYKAATNMYDRPNGFIFSWGGVCYFRLIHWLQDQQNIINTFITLRALNILFSLVTSLFVALIAYHLFGATASIMAAALSLFFPSHVLESHYVRPDVMLTMFCTISLYFAIKLGCYGNEKYAFWAALFGGLAVSTMQWGICTFVPIIVAGVASYKQHSNKAIFIFFLKLSVFSISGAIIGYCLGSIETFFLGDLFRKGYERTLSVHKSSLFFPVSKLTVTSIYAFGFLGTLFAYIGFIWMIIGRERRALILCSYFLFAWVLHSIQRFGYMRYLLFLSPVMAISASAALVYLHKKIPYKIAQVIWVCVVAFTFQISLGYVIPMHFFKDIRYRTSEWLLDQIPSDRIAHIGITRSYYGDWTYQPRFPRTKKIVLHGLMLRANYDASHYTEQKLDYIVTSDYAVAYATGKTAPKFFKDLFAPSIAYILTPILNFLLRFFTFP